jgi:hypothetical protein
MPPTNRLSWMLSWGVFFHLLPSVFDRTTVRRFWLFAQIVVTEVGVCALTIFMFMGGHIGAMLNYSGAADFVTGARMEVAVIPSALGIFLVARGTLIGVANVLLAKSGNRPTRPRADFAPKTMFVKDLSVMGASLVALKTRSLLLIGVIVVAVVAAGEYYTQTFSSSGTTVNIQILGGVGPGTIDIYSPDNFTVTQGEHVSLAILNTDDNTHGFTMKAFGVDTGVILPGQTMRVSFVANQTGMFEFLEPPGYCTGGVGHVCNSVQHMWGYMTVTP